MMINKENQTNAVHNNKKIDTARMGVHAVLVIKDKTTKEILVNKRG